MGITVCPNTWHPRITHNYFYNNEELMPFRLHESFILVKISEIELLTA